jgi:hypothetical protein
MLLARAFQQGLRRVRDSSPFTTPLSLVDSWIDLQRMQVFGLRRTGAETLAEGDAETSAMQELVDVRRARLALTAWQAHSDSSVRPPQSTVVGPEPDEEARFVRNVIAEQALAYMAALARAESAAGASAAAESVLDELLALVPYVPVVRPSSLPGAGLGARPARRRGALALLTEARCRVQGSSCAEAHVRDRSSRFSAELLCVVAVCVCVCVCV